jgi:ssDNA-binding Zn-finger/Zn-ribbon topoisomerase 1
VDLLVFLIATQGSFFLGCASAVVCQGRKKLKRESNYGKHYGVCQDREGRRLSSRIQPITAGNGLAVNTYPGNFKIAGSFSTQFQVYRLGTE